MKDYRNWSIIVLFLLCATFLGFYHPAEAMPLIAAMASGVGAGIAARGYQVGRENNQPKADG